MGLDASRPLSVSRVAARLAEIIDVHLRGVRAIWVQGDVGDLRSDTRGTLRFTLSDATSRIECVWWTPPPGAAPALADGMQVVVKGRPKVFTRTVGLVYVVAEVRPVGAGVSSRAREQLRLRLTAEGLFDPGRRRGLPAVPRAVAVITGHSSAAWHDVLAVARRRHPGIQVVLVPAQMQGEAAPASICTALRAAEASGLFDIVLITRGGGGAADLSAFDNETLVRALAACSVAVVTAIGHETDFSFADAVADRREPTPSAAAARVIPDRQELGQHVHACHVSMSGALGQRLERETTRVITAQSTLGHSALVRIETGRRRLDRAEIGVVRALERRLERAREHVLPVESRLRGTLPYLVGTARSRMVASKLAMRTGMDRLIVREQERSRLTRLELQHAVGARMAELCARHERAASHLALLDPLAVLRRGYAVVRDGAGAMLTSASQAPLGVTLILQFHDGRVRVSVSAAILASAPEQGVEE